MRKVKSRSPALTLSRWLVGRYPRAWRERYELEVLSLLDDSAPRTRDVLDLAQGLAVERVSATFEPGDRPILMATLLIAGHLGLAMALPLATAAAGWGARLWFGDLPRPIDSLAYLLHFAIVTAFVVRIVQTYQANVAAYDRRDPIPPLFSPRVGMMWIAALLIAAFLGTWAVLFSERHTWLTAVTYGALLGHQQSWLRWRQVYAGVRRLAAAARTLQGAMLELDRCERVAAQGLASPLEEARHSVARLSLERHEARVALHAMGYRAGLARPHGPGHDATID